MSVIIEKARRELLDDYCRVEAASGIGMSYLRDVFDYFHGYTVGDLICGYMDGELAGIGKLTRLYDGSAWLETLRVDKKYQGRGVGKAFYKRFLEEAKSLGCPAVRMYTGVNNDVSAGLARINGLETVAVHQGVFLTQDEFSTAKLPEGFRMATPMEAVAAYKGRNSGFCCLNRTFYAKSADTFAGFAAQGMVFVHPRSGSALVLGARFQRDKGLHMSEPLGDVRLCVEFAAAYTAAAGLPRLTCTFGEENTELRALLESRGFTTEPYATMVMEGIVKAV